MKNTHFGFRFIRFSLVKLEGKMRGKTIFLSLILGFFGYSLGQDCPKASFFVNELTNCVHPDNDLSPMGYAEMYCQAFGGHLLSINSSAINSLVTGIQLTTLNGPQGFLGARRVNGVWTWTDGSPFTYTRWGLGQPAAGDCVTLDSNAYTWRTVDCSQNYPYLCGIPNIIQPDCTATQIPILCPSGSFFVQETQSCLHADNNAVSFFLAEKYTLVYCQAYNGHLFSIHDGDTDDFLTGVSYTLINGNQFWIGGRRNSSYGWTDDTAFDYTNWAAGEPPADCAIIQKDTALWNGVDCSTPLPFMCNIPPIINGGCTSPAPPQTVTAAPVTDAPTDAPTTFGFPTITPLNCLPPESQPLYNCQQGWQYSVDTGYFYLIVYDSTFSQAEAYCQTQGAHLASIHSKVEDSFITNLCCSSDCTFRREGQNGWSYAGVTIIGAHRIGGVWTWTDGTPWDYEQQICEEGDGDFLWTKEDDCTADCGENYGGWGTASAPDADGAPYFVCKKATL